MLLACLLPLLAVVAVAPRPASKQEMDNTAPPTTPVTTGSITLTPVGNFKPAAQTVTIEPGKSETLANKHHVLSCPAGGAACVVKVAADGTATYSGAKPTVGLTALAQTIISTPTPDTPADKQKKYVKGLYEAASSAITKVDNYSSDSVVETAGTALKKFTDAVYSADSVNNLSSSDLEDYQGKATTLDKDLAGRKKARIALIRKNEKSQKWVDAITNYSPSTTLRKRWKTSKWVHIGL